LAAPAPVTCSEPTAELEAPLAARVLVVDDNQDAGDCLGLLLQTWGYETRVAYDGPEAVRLARNWHPTVILLDIQLPGCDGYEVARQLKQDAHLHDTALIALTGHASDEDRRLTEQAGFDAHLIKPVRPEELRSLLQTVALQTA
jgi:CheY-like chemotaxis protein